MPRWERRFRAPEVSLPDWSARAPDRLVYTGTESGVWQVHTRGPDGRRQVTDHPVGVITGAIDPDGERVLYWQDETGDEAGRWYSQPFEGGAATELLLGAPIGWNEGFSIVRGVAAAGISDADGFTVFVSIDDGPVNEIARSAEALGVGDGGLTGGLSADGALLCLHHSEHGNAMHPGVRIVDPRGGRVVAELVDDGMRVGAGVWSPVEGDERLAIVHERGGEEATAVWSPRSGDRVEIDAGLEGPVIPLDWWPDASALLLRHEVDGRHRLHRFDLETGVLTPVGHPEGEISSARVRPDGRVWFRHSSGATHPRVLDDAGDKVLPLEGDLAPGGRPYVSWWFDNGVGDRVQGFYVTPEGEGPWPILLHPHGGPTWLDEDRWNPEIQALVDAGFAVALVNFRGSTGRGAAWRDALIGDIGGPEIEDLNAALADLVARGIADPERAAVGGWSWGGYLTLMELCTHPDMWRAGVAGVPVGDYEMSYEDLSPNLQAYDRALLGGRPDEVPELMASRNPINLVDRVRAPVIFLIGEHDSRCPPRQAFAFVDRLAARNHPHEVVTFATGHGSFDVDEEVRQVRAILAFLARHVPGIDPDPA